MEKLYKVIKSNRSCNGGDFDWNKHLPKSDSPGKWTPRITDLRECSKGYHVTPYWNMWYEEGCTVFECETKGLQKKEGPGVIDKYVCESVRLLKKVEMDFTGCWNTGDSNTGCFNTKEPEYYELFNQPIARMEYESIEWPDWFYFDLLEEGYKASWIKSFGDAHIDQVKAAIELPNFDYTVFEEITGISEAMISDKLEGAS